MAHTATQLNSICTLSSAFIKTPAHRFVFAQRAVKVCGCISIPHPAAVRTSRGCKIAKNYFVAASTRCQSGDGSWAALLTSLDSSDSAARASDIIKCARERRRRATPCSGGTHPVRDWAMQSSANRATGSCAHAFAASRLKCRMKVSFHQHCANIAFLEGSGY